MPHNVDHVPWRHTEFRGERMFRRSAAKQPPHESYLRLCELRPSVARPAWLPPLLYLVAIVGSLVADKEMAWVDAGWHVTAVQDVAARRHGAVARLPGEPMGTDGSLSAGGNVKDAVSESRDGRGPIPADRPAAALVDLRPKALPVASRGSGEITATPAVLLRRVSRERFETLVAVGASEDHVPDYFIILARLQ